jgi:hypothetical protein
MCKFLIFAVASLCALPVHLAGQNTEKQFDGCLTEIPNGGFQFEASPSGTVYVLSGNSDELAQHVHEFVRVRASRVPSKNDNQAPLRLSVQTIDVIGQSCTSVLPGENPVAVGGKAGEGQVAVPLTTSASAGETTPGFQTETIAGQEPPNNGRSMAVSSRAVRPPYAPSNTAQAAQSAAAANRYAEAATRSEIQPGKTLGTDLPASQAQRQQLPRKP